MNIIIAGVKPIRENSPYMNTFISIPIVNLGLPKITFMFKNSLEGLTESGFILMVMVYYRERI